MTNLGEEGLTEPWTIAIPIPDLSASALLALAFF